MLGNSDILNRINELERKINLLNDNQIKSTFLHVKNSNDANETLEDIKKQLNYIKSANKYNSFQKTETGGIHKKAICIIDDISDILIDLHELTK